MAKICTIAVVSLLFILFTQKMKVLLNCNGQEQELKLHMTFCIVNSRSHMWLHGQCMCVCVWGDVQYVYVCMNMHECVYLSHSVTEAEDINDNFQEDVPVVLLFWVLSMNKSWRVNY